MTPSIQDRAVADVLAERSRQDMTWGEQDHDPITWLAILSEEVGEVAQAMLRLRFGPRSRRVEYEVAYRDELIQVAAVALAMLECWDRSFATPPAEG